MTPEEQRNLLIFLKGLESMNYMPTHGALEVLFQDNCIIHISTTERLSNNIIRNAKSICKKRYQ
jgi:hypothetical protein